MAKLIRINNTRTYLDPDEVFSVTAYKIAYNSSASAVINFKNGKEATFSFETLEESHKFAEETVKQINDNRTLFRPDSPYR